MRLYNDIANYSALCHFNSCLLLLQIHKIKTAPRKREAVFVSPTEGIWLAIIFSLYRNFMGLVEKGV